MRIAKIIYVLFIGLVIFNNPSNAQTDLNSSVEKSTGRGAVFSAICRNA